MSDAKYTLYYWPMAFRGCFISYQFAYKNEPLTLAGTWESIAAMNAEQPEEQNIPCTGPPVLFEHETGRYLSQTPAIILYAASKLGLAPADPYDTAMCLKVQMDCNDVLMEICRHNGSTMWTRDEWVQFRTKRLPRWMRVFEESVKRGFIGKEQVTFADISVFALFGTMTRCLPELDGDLLQHAPNVHQLCKRMGETPSLAKAVELDEQRAGKTYCGGQIEASIREMLAGDRQG